MSEELNEAIEKLIQLYKHFSWGAIKYELHDHDHRVSLYWEGQANGVACALTELGIPAEQLSEMYKEIEAKEERREAEKVGE